MTYFSTKDSLFDITEKYPQTLEIFVAQGFVQLADEQKRATMGKSLQLDIALSMRNIDEAAFHNLLIQAIESKGNSNVTNKPEKQLRIKGLLPCPVRLPLQEELDAFIAQSADKMQIEAHLKAASMGLDWMKDEVINAEAVEELDDLYISAGFDMFFEQAYFGRFIKTGEFADPLPWKKVNKDFDNKQLRLKDPQGRYGIIAVVPAIFLVNTQVLGERPVPQSWEDLLNPVYANSISLPVSDFDLFNAILLTLSQRYGRDAITALGMNMQQSMHPAQMVKSERSKNQKPAITIMPYFFTKMAKAGGVMTAVWPEDGAIISPIFAIGKTKRFKQMDSLSDFLGSEKLAEILSHQGLFPSLNPMIDNKIPTENTYMWLGWEFIDSHNLNQEFEQCEKLFNIAHIQNKPS
ncbi:MAG: ABC transporter substrate-binding protein [Bacteroidetes bacterium]|nr:ABC transporter substrate-binding protein [Bacteroidota bacterium]MBU1580535.1 ABC transporter substrate-binding protein [Bacteroidota bacterium]MBU2466011.1 ABC transporter substrate-binding protein [Bacteroidota bacterium]MBU2557788.1 ABC transporter substrate-binding protein [Bacteroidota bacterium]